MANNKQRYVNTRFWNDTFVSKLKMPEKLVFIYLLTNEHTNISGIYELPLKVMTMETDIKEDTLVNILPKLNEKITYQSGYVVIRNFLKHQETGSDLTMKGIINCLRDLDIKFLKTLVKNGHYVVSESTKKALCLKKVKTLTRGIKPLARVSNYLDSDLDSNSNSNLNSDSDLNLDLDSDSNQAKNSLSRERKRKNASIQGAQIGEILGITRKKRNLND